MDFLYLEIQKKILICFGAALFMDNLEGLWRQNNEKRVLLIAIITL